MKNAISHLDESSVGLWPTVKLRVHREVERIPRLDETAYQAFRADITNHGILEPLHLTAKGVVLDGRERLRAASELGLAELPGLVVSPTDPIEYIYRRALTRRHLDASVRAALTLELVEYQQLLADGRSRSQRNLSQQRTVEVAALPPREKTRDQLSSIAGVSARTVQDAITVHTHDPALFDQVKQGRIPVHRAARRVRREQIRRSAAPARPLPDGLFEVVYVDPAWQMDTLEIASGPEDHYPTMSLAEIKALQIPAADKAVLFLWRVNSLAREAYDVLDAWGFEYKAEIIWVKPSIGPGSWVRNRHEVLLVATRDGYPTPTPKGRPDSVIEAPRGRHSEKPKAFYELIEAAYPSESKLEMFARGKARPGWAVWGNQAEPETAP